METTNQETENLIDPELRQASALEESSFVRLARLLRKVSRQFGWPMLVFLLLGPPALRSPTSDVFPIYLLLGVFPVLGGLVLRLWARGYFRTDGFVMDGPYRYVRNPVELGALFVYVGAGIISGIAMWYVVLAVFVGFVYLSISASSYEQDILMKVGGPYLRYCKRVKRWIPSSLPGTNRSARTYSTFHALRFERESLIWLVLYLLVFAVRQNLLFKIS